ncbi:inactive hydroxysteroid dehydrogenase-like protein 1 [Littorina saxatilis]|uniref:Inactive hydroxysteroid dehydrogenase-like protein 1 n=1 Tax=Littorina saxatilis TaxID=31220 RepID=A0AAN9B576_9CAEN
MAAVDSFELLFREISKVFSSYRDALALIGAYYVAKRSLTFASYVGDALYVHLYGRFAQEEDLRQKFGSWAVVTGSSDGIGRAYARQLARRGMNIVLLSRDEKKLMHAAQDIVSEHGVEVEYICVDFAADAQDELYNTIWTALAGKEIGVLVNNVGVMYDFPQYFLDVSEKKLWQLIFINVATATIMTHMVLPQMVKRKRGAIVNVSSGSCSQITPQMTVYAATKSYLDYFSQALEYEYRDDGITVQCLMPFYVATRMTRYSETLSKTSFFIPNADTFARSAVRTLGFSTRTTGYFPHTMQSWITALCPEWLWKMAASRVNTSLRQHAKVRRERHRAMHGSVSTQSMSDEYS